MMTAMLQSTLYGVAYVGVTKVILQYGTARRMPDHITLPYYITTLIILMYIISIIMFVIIN